MPCYATMATAILELSTEPAYLLLTLLLMQLHYGVRALAWKLRTLDSSFWIQVMVEKGKTWKNHL